MATENPSSAYAASSAPRSNSSASADSYIGSLISLTSKSEIRYEGVLFNINTDESSIGLKNVRSFGTEGRKKDGPQVPSSDKVYEYILFRGSDIKDLQVKSSPPVQSAPTINNDPAIIQSHYPQPVSTSTNLPSSGSGPSQDPVSNTPQMGLPGTNYQGGLPLYHPSGNLGSWGASPAPNATGSGLAMATMYWPGYYPSPNGLPHMPHQSIQRPTPGLQIPPLQQPMPMQHPGFNNLFPTGASNLPGSLAEGPSPLFPPNSSSLSMPSNFSVSLPSNVTPAAPATLPPTITPIPSATPSSDTLLNSIPNKAQASSLPPVGANPNFMSLPPLTNPSPVNFLATPVTAKLNPIVGPTLPFQGSSQPAESILGPSDSSNVDAPNATLQAPTPSLITPGHLLQSGTSAIPSSQLLQAAHKDVEVVQISQSPPNPSASVNTDAQPPILPLPPQAWPIENGPPFQSRYGYRGRDRGRGGRVQNSRPVTKFTEDFDFTAMNEKFKKNEVWGHLGKSSKHHSKDRDSDGDVSEEDNFHDDIELPKIDIKPVYNKDDFFDSISCNALDHNSQVGRTRFSEQMKLDTETFGDFSRYRGGRFGHGRNSGGGARTRGYYGRGYGYGGGRGQGRGTYARPL
ncbi:hypothetical protein MLD38_007489 [Melastoma candidum]|uniref:Uncharacterized protein n=1 Tax=Melastoma candidum TaxID=119954 RepID=A0ACB9RQX8_9MYRT|nr:hypothetical protein MLD38_007489 [Melastoma candidum]